MSLARAVLRNPAVLILDEATSAVDTRTEAAIQQNLYAFREGRLTLAVAHRLSTVRQCSEILVVVDGSVVERGTHEKLLATGGVYASMLVMSTSRGTAKNFRSKRPRMTTGCSVRPVTSTRRDGLMTAEPPASRASRSA